MNKGLVYVFTGDGKGKTSAAMGVAVRAAMMGMRVGWVAWYKNKDWDISEYRLGRVLPRVKFFPMGVGFRFKNYESRIMNNGKEMKVVTVGKSKVVDKASEAEHKDAAQRAMEKAQELLGEVDVLVLDEINNAVADKLVKLTNLIGLIAGRGRTHVILTGRGAHPKIVEMADLVTEMKKIKHPFDKGVMAVKGLDF